MTTTEELAEFVNAVSHEDFSENTREELKKRTLDSLGIGIAALGHEPVEDVHDTCRRANPGTGCTLWGRSDSASPVGAAMHNTALTRYLDFMDSFLAPGETPHPSDNIGAVVAAGEEAGATGEELLEGIGAAYEVQGELAWNAPVRDEGFDHVTHTVISAACGVAKMLNLDIEATRNANGIAGTPTQLSVSPEPVVSTSGKASRLQTLHAMRRTPAYSRRRAWKGRRTSSRGRRAGSRSLAAISRSISTPLARGSTT